MALRSIINAFFFAAVLVLSISTNVWLTNTAFREFPESFLVTQQDISSGQNSSPRDSVSVIGGHWEYSSRKIPPYNYSDEVCRQTSIKHHKDCTQVENCIDNLMNWQYVTSDNTPYPTFDADGFRRNMKDKRVLFLGDSTVRQQMLALVWSLGLDHVDWKDEEGGMIDTQCTTDPIGNITICRQFMGRMATQVYQEGSYILNLTEISGQGDTSYLLQDEMLDQIAEFDLVFIQGVVWFAGIQRVFESPTSPAEWIHELLPKLYRDVMEVILSKLAYRTKTIVVLGQSGTTCINKTEPEPYYPDRIPDSYAWNVSPKLWDQSLNVIKDLSLDVQVVDAREPLMQSVHARPAPDCLHFCMTSAALNMYLDMYWNEVFRYVQE